MREVLEDIRNVKEEQEEVEEDSLKRLNDAIFRCGNIHSEYEKITLYVNGLSNTIVMLVSHYLDSGQHCYLTFEILCYFDKSEDEYYHARI